MKRTGWILFFIFILSGSFHALADDYDFNQTRMKFENFVRCELTRTDSISIFMGKPFEITMINFYDIRAESDIRIATGAVQCFVENKNETLFIALGLNKVLGKEKVSWYVIRPEDFTILATELIQHPYKERCGWTQFRIDIN